MDREHDYHSWKFVTNISSARNADLSGADVHPLLNACHSKCKTPKPDVLGDYRLFRCIAIKVLEPGHLVTNLGMPPFFAVKGRIQPDQPDVEITRPYRHHLRVMAPKQSSLQDPGSFSPPFVPHSYYTMRFYIENYLSFCQWEPLRYDNPTMGKFWLCEFVQVGQEFRHLKCCAN